MCNDCEKLKAENEKLKGQLKALHQCVEINAKNELDGYKYKLATMLKSEYRDFGGEYAPEEQAEVYRAILEDLFVKLAAMGVKFED